MAGVEMLIETSYVFSVTRLSIRSVPGFRGGNETVFRPDAFWRFTASS
jgi:hypothetical protein